MFTKTGTIEGWGGLTGESGGTGPVGDGGSVLAWPPGGVNAHIGRPIAYIPTYIGVVDTP
jgi:hypothetical protein